MAVSNVGSAKRLTRSLTSLNENPSRQLTTLVKWTEAATAQEATGALLAVGDVLPLAMAWVASKDEKTRRKEGRLGRPVPYAFVGTAKSEFYVREVDGKKLVPEKRDAGELEAPV
jgi:hypothetical protein